jgi:phage terminase large subunit-like protein
MAKFKSIVNGRDLTPRTYNIVADYFDTEDVVGAQPWHRIARKDQLPPDGDWFVWLILAGRGWGKSRTAAEWCLAKARRYPGARIALVAATASDVRDTMVEGESGLLACMDPAEMRGGSIDRAYNRSLGEIFMANGSRFKGYTGETPRRLRGPQHNFAWADEAAYWTDAYKGPVTDTVWSNLVIGTRLPKRRGWDDDYKTQIVVATTPRPVALLHTTDPHPSRAGLMQRETTIVTRGRTVDNLGNLSDTYRATVVAPLLGTRLGRQELDGELLEDREDSLWKRDDIDRQRIAPTDVPDLIRVVVGVDPAVSDGETAANTGIVVAGASKDGHGYVLADWSLRGSPMQAMKRVVEAYNEFQADRVVAEINNGGDYIGTLLRTVDAGIAYRPVRASRGKAIRAEPVSALYEQGRVHHSGSFPQLEDEMVMWAPSDPVSPDRMDALVWAFYDLKDLISGSWYDAYGVTHCDECDHVFLKGDKIACPKCNALLPIEEKEGVG